MKSLKSIFKIAGAVMAVIGTVLVILGYAAAEPAPAKARKADFIVRV